MILPFMEIGSEYKFQLQMQKNPLEKGDF
jgi:hypothetical protein